MAEAFGKTERYYNGIHALKKLRAAIDSLPDAEKKNVAELRDEAALMIGDFYLKKGDAKEALEAYRDATRGTGGTQACSWAYIKWGELLMKQGAFDNASRIFQHVTGTMPEGLLYDIARSHLNTIEWQRRNRDELKKLL